MTTGQMRRDAPDKHVGSERSCSSWAGRLRDPTDQVSRPGAWTAPGRFSESLPRLERFKSSLESPAPGRDSAVALHTL
jgi:hypothetical protein